jgi:hypothetical protein
MKPAKLQRPRLSADLPADALRQPSAKRGFNWVNNDDGIGTGPSVAIDALQAIATTTPARLPHFDVE